MKSNTVTPQKRIDNQRVGKNIVSYSAGQRFARWKKNFGNYGDLCELGRHLAMLTIPRR